ncbi:MAG: sulfatase-like hydrolase/transferase [Dehalococcoidia bacterium]|nr:sulfatase-like hydrolase/transferase [Dehalococcoidia bacterium]
MTDRPNFLVIMSDEHGPMWSSAYGHPFVQTPNMERLAESGATFDAAYCNSPLCVPSRLSFMTGRYVSRCEGWDNAKPLPSDAPTWPYLLRSMGYDSALSGKMHLIGPDQLHGFRDQLAYDPHGGGHRGDSEASLSTGGLHPIYLWEEGVPTSDEPWPSVSEARAGTGPMIEADDAIEEAALAYLRDPARQDSLWALCVGFVAPHFPFIVPEPYFSLYWPEYADLPNNPPGHLDNLPAAANRLMQAFNFSGYTEDEVRTARAAYYGLITYLDDKIGRLLDALEDAGMSDNTVVIHTSDHGESLGEHGLWRKMNFYEQSARVPLQISWPSVIDGGQRFTGAVSLVDATATILDIASADQASQSVMNLDGTSLLPQMTGATVGQRDEAFSEHLAHGTDRPRAMLRQGRWKLCYSHHAATPDLELYNLETDPGEFVNLANDGTHSAVQQRLTNRILDIWGDAGDLDRRIKDSQRSRLMIRDVLGEAATF